MSGWALQRPSIPSRLASWFPYPYVGVTVVLLALLFLTPVLFEGGPPAPGSLFTQAELSVDWAATTNTLNFYLYPFQQTVQYAALSIGIATNFTFNGTFPTGPLSWTWTNGTDLLELSVAVPAGSVAVHVLATYTLGGQAVYEGILAFGLWGPPSDQSLGIAVAPATPGVTAPASVLVTDLPIAIPLQYCGSGACV